ncbi:glycosyltransferase 87 family protein [Rhodococcus tukisamuensis]|uniref:Alpha-1,2-mannosyltransferase n=1 Tax=Rhodococcus tukisamuensis TaxID=168276 RepID=A0A1G6WYB7_9NOCA|nr:glycosyltransferase 87 family protein [Rhodococcus tukisamuensis]SDD70912.1 alpha-1,2-mannosyltransferase [Rhodococcus tukisamuensis]
MRGGTRDLPAPDSDATGTRGDRRLAARWPALAGMALAAIATTVLLVATVDPWLPNTGLFMGGMDLDVYRNGARHVLAGLPLYTEPVIHGLLYTYTPFSTLMFVPVDLLPDEAGQYIWMGFNLVVLVAVVTLCWRILGYRITGRVVGVSALLSLACVFLEPVRTTLFFGQINLVLMLLVLWDTSRGETSRLRGVGVGIAAGIKLTPAYFVLYYLALRQWRAAAVSTITILTTIAVSWAVLPKDSQHYWTATFFDSTRIADEAHAANQSLRGALTRIIGDPAPTWLWLLLAAAVVAVSMWVVARLHRRGEALLAVTVAGFTAAVVSPFSWSHHWVWFVPLLVWTVHRALTNTWWWLGLVALFGVAGSWAYHFPDRLVVGLYLFPASWIPWDVLVNLYVVAYAVVLVGAAVIAVRPPPDRPRPLTLTEGSQPPIGLSVPEPDAATPVR